MPISVQMPVTCVVRMVPPDILVNDGVLQPHDEAKQRDGELDQPVFDWQQMRGAKAEQHKEQRLEHESEGVFAAGIARAGDVDEDSGGHRATDEAGDEDNRGEHHRVLVERKMRGDRGDEASHMRGVAVDHHETAGIHRAGDGGKDKCQLTGCGEGPLAGSEAAEPSPERHEALRRRKSFVSIVAS